MVDRPWSRACAGDRAVRCACPRSRQSPWAWAARASGATCPPRRRSEPGLGPLARPRALAALQFDPQPARSPRLLPQVAQLSSTPAADMPTWARIITTSHRYANGVVMVHGGPSGCTFTGTDGTLRIDRDHLSSDPATIVKDPLGGKDVHIEKSPGHHRNWLDCIRSRKRPWPTWRSAPARWRSPSPATSPTGTAAASAGIRPSGSSWMTRKPTAGSTASAGIRGSFRPSERHSWSRSTARGFSVFLPHGRLLRAKLDDAWSIHSALLPRKHRCSQ